MQKLIVDFECRDKGKEEEVKGMIQKSLFSIMSEHDVNLRYYSTLALFPSSSKSDLDIKKELNIPEFLKRKTSS